MKPLWDAFLRNRKRVGEVALAVIGLLQVSPQVRDHANISLALAAVALAIRTAGSEKSDGWYKEKQEVEKVLERNGLA